jgi:hypothetical protein
MMNMKLKMKKVLAQIKAHKFGVQYYQVPDPQFRRAAHAPMCLR